MLPANGRLKRDLRQLDFQLQLILQARAGNMCSYVQGDGGERPMDRSFQDLCGEI